VTAGPDDLTGHAARLRREFDGGFARPFATAGSDGVELLAIRVAGHGYAIRLAEIAGLFADRTVTPVPGPLPELRGLANLRGALVPVYDLGLLLGHPAGDAPRWLALATARRVALAFDGLDGHTVAAPDAIAMEPGEGRALRQIVHRADGAGQLLLLHLPSLLDDIAARARRAGGPEGR